MKNIFRPKSLKKLLLALFILLGQFFLFQFLADWKYFIESIHPKIPTFWSSMMSPLIDAMAFSLGDILYIFLVFWLLFLVFKLIKNLTQRNRNGLFKTFVWLLITTNIFYFSFQILWGLQYNRRHYFEKYFVEDIETEELKLLATKLLQQAKTLREECEEDSDNYFISSLTDNQLEKEMTKYWSKEFKESWISKYYPKAKPSLFSSFLGFLGVGGYYNPFTTEAQFNANVPDTKHPFNVMHELSHQMGFAPEQDANLVGFLSCYHSDKIQLNYVANWKGMKYALYNVYPSDSLFVDSVLNCYSPAMKRDRELEIYYNKKDESILSDYFSQFNDWFLKSNNQDDGVKSYGLFISYLIGLQRAGELD